MRDGAAVMYQEILDGNHSPQRLKKAKSDPREKEFDFHLP